MNILLTAPVDRILDFDIQTLYSWGIQLVNTLVIVYILYRILYKPVLEFLDKRAKNIEGTITNANKTLSEANELKTKYEAMMASAGAEKKQILEEASKNARELEASIVNSAKEEANRIKEIAAKEIELQKDKAQRDMKEQILDISALIAGRYVESAMDVNLQNKLLDDAINDLGDATWLS
jgi:F-type H+-transporting ATPase subunit b